MVVGATVAALPGPLYTVEPDYTDHARHEYAAWAALQIGPRIWTDPLVEWDVEPFDDDHAQWPTIAHPYPPGSLVLFLPAGVAVGTGLVPQELGHVLLVAGFVLGAGAATGLLARLLEGSWPAALRGVVVALVAVDLLGWALDGFFDPIAVAVALGGLLLLRRDRTGAALLVLAAALSLHLRLWFLLPVVAAAALRHRRLDRWTVAAAAVLAVSAASAVLLLPSFAALPAASDFQPNPLRGSPAAWVLAAVAVVVVGVAERRGDDRGAVVTATTALAFAVLLANPQWQAWYPLAFVPVLGLLRAPAAQAVGVLAYVQLLLVVPGAAGALVLLRELGTAFAAA